MSSHTGHSSDDNSHENDIASSSDYAESQTEAEASSSDEAESQTEDMLVSGRKILSREELEKLDRKELVSLLVSFQDELKDTPMQSDIKNEEKPTLVTTHDKFYD